MPVYQAKHHQLHLSICDGIDDTCTFCNTVSKSVLHIMWDCQLVQKLWQNLRRWLNYILGMELLFSKEVTICNHYRGQCKELINTILLITKQYMYAAKCKKEKLVFVNLAKGIYDIQKLERIIALRQNRYYKYMVKWGRIAPDQIRVAPVYIVCNCLKIVRKCCEFLLNTVPKIKKYKVKKKKLTYSGKSRCVKTTKVWFEVTTYK